MSENACGLHELGGAYQNDCPHCTKVRISARDAEIERLAVRNQHLQAEIERLRGEELRLTGLVNGQSLEIKRLRRGP